MVPKNALAVYETEQPIKIWNSLLELPVWKNLSSIPVINDVNEDLVLLDSITGSSGSLEKLFRDRPILVSLHKISNTDFGLTFYFTLNSVEKRKILSSILEHFENLQNYKFDIRKYEDFSINELSNDEGEIEFTFIEYKGHFVGSFTSFLIDDVIRNISNGFQANFKSISTEIFNTQPIEMDEGNLYLNLAKTPDLLRNFSVEDKRKDYDDYLKWFTGATYYDIAFENNRIFFNGSTKIPENGNEYFLSTFYNQSPQNVEAIYYLPNRTATYVSYTYEDFTNWRKSVDVFWEKNFPQALDMKIELLKKYDIYEKDLYGWIGNEIGLATLQSIDLDHPDKLLIIRSKDYSESVKTLDDLIMVANDLNSDTLLYEDYSGKRIKKQLFYRPGVLYRNR
jgi:hypothetical protein